MVALWVVWILGLVGAMTRTKVAQRTKTSVALVSMALTMSVNSCRGFVVN